MGYSREIYDAAMAALEQRRTLASAQAAALHDDMTKQYPRIREIEREMAGSSLQVAKAVLDGGDVETAVERIKTANLGLQKELADILHAAGRPEDNFEPSYICPCCRDTGYTTKGEVCSCLKSLLKDEACRRLSRSISMELTNFEDMKLSYYADTPDPRTGKSPRERMRDVLDYCRHYAETFSPDRNNLLFRGPTGTGKTHVSLAIAKAAAEKGYGVVYGPVQVLLHRLEKEHFGRAEGNSEDMLNECDLLILDDLGTEFSSPFYVSCLYNIINTRLLEHLPTIISTNCEQAELMDRYGEQITSRLIGHYEPVRFWGKDIRQIKAAERMGGRC